VLLYDKAETLRVSVGRTFGSPSIRLSAIRFFGGLEISLLAVVVELLGGHRP
jgi:hypothetical protein